MSYHATVLEKEIMNDKYECQINVGTRIIYVFNVFEEITSIKITNLSSAPVI